MHSITRSRPGPVGHKRRIDVRSDRGGHTRRVSLTNDPSAILGLGQFAVGDAAADKQPMESVRLVGGWDHRSRGPVVVAASFGTVASAVTVPRPLAPDGGDLVAADNTMQAPDVDAVVLRDCEHVAHAG